MAKKKIYSDIEFLTEIVAESKSAYGLKTYISLFSSAGVGCYGLQARRLLLYCNGRIT